MAVSTRSEFVDFIVPLHERLKLYDTTRRSTDQPQNNAADPARAIPQGFIDAMTVREQVFVEEQGVPQENELDEDDERSFHWVAYASIPVKQNLTDGASQDANGTNGHAHMDRRTSTSTKIPIGTIRLVPPPHPPHPTPGTHHKADALDGDLRKDSAIVHDSRVPYIKLGRLAVIPEFRKAGISKLLIEQALGFAKANPYEIMPYHDPTKVEALRHENGGVGVDWTGLVLVHAQAAPGVQRVWRKYGFEADETMGIWDEEGIDHVGMWRRLDVDSGRRRSRQWPLHSPLGSP